MKSVIIWIAGVAFASIVCAQGDAAIGIPILLNTLSGKVVLTREMHQDFWREIRKGPPMSDAELRTLVTGPLEINLAFQEAMWVSAQESYLAKRVIETLELERVEAKFLERVGAYIPAPVGSRQQRDAIAELTRRFRSMQRDKEILLNAAASRGSFELSNGDTGTMSEATVRDTLSRLRAAKRRIEQLANPIWSEAQP